MKYVAILFVMVALTGCSIFGASTDKPESVVTATAA